MPALSNTRGDGAPPQLSVTTSWEGATAVLTLAGELDLATVEQVRAAVAPVRERSRVIRFELSGLQFIDSSGIGLIYKLDAQSRADGFDFVVSGAGSHVRRVFELVGLTEHVRVEDA